jgi:hypothetical protein
MGDRMNTTQSRIGTRQEFRTWLTSMKNMNYTFYSKLSTDRKAQIQDDYSKRQNSCRSTVIVVEPKTEVDN